MSEDPAAGEELERAKPRLGALTWALWGAALIGVAAVLYIMAQSSTKPPEVAVGPVAPVVKPLADKLTRPDEPTPPPDYVFYDEAGKPKKISDFKGKVVVMNIWATWCAPCKAEMPTLAKLAAAYKGKDVEVVTISIDKPEAGASAKLFIAQNDPLKFYHDREAKLIFKLSPPAEGAPVTVIYGKDGREAARVSGEADWMGKDARALVDAELAKS